MAEDRFEDIYPLSATQRGMLVHSLYEREEGVYYQCLNARIDRELDAAAFRRAWETVVARHPVLRTAFLWENRKEPLQVVFRRVALPWTELDWRDLSASEQAERLAALLDEDRARGFDFKRPPLLRFTLIRLAERAWQYFFDGGFGL